MRKTIIVTFILFLVACYILHVSIIHAADRLNNPIGMHVAGLTDQDLSDVALLVNSNGGDWGYITFVIQENDRDKNKWQTIFDKLRRFHLIPIVRLATSADGSVWKRPSKDDADGWANFLNSLNWVVKDRYVILFNEPNHGQEWGGSVDAKNYADVAQEFAQKLKQKNGDFKVMLAGLDASSPEAGPEYADEENFMSEILQETPTIFDNIDGLASHSYPNPGFSGSPSATGRISVYGYEWELNMLQQLGVKKELPVFITETGWVHDVGTNINNMLSVDTVAQDYKTYLSQVTKDSRVKAVTPFVLDYQGDPFSHFSWKKLGSSDFYPQYSEVQSIPKIQGDPEQILKITSTAELPKFLLTDSSYKVRLYITNKGQAILDGGSGYSLQVSDASTKMTYSFSTFVGLEPDHMGIIDFHLKTNNTLGPQSITVGLYKDNVKQMDLFTWNLELKPKPNITFKTTLFPKISSKDDNYEIQIYDKNKELVYKKDNISVSNNKGAVLGASDVALNDGKYRVVVLKPYYIPIQKIVSFKEGDNALNFKAMIPVDFNRDGKFSIEDIGALIQKPSLLGLWLP